MPSKASSGSPPVSDSLSLQASASPAPPRFGVTGRGLLRTADAEAGEGGGVRSGLCGLWRSLVSASVWGTEGPGFESRQPDHQHRRSAGTCRKDGTLTRGPDTLNVWEMSGCEAVAEMGHQDSGRSRRAADHQSQLHKGFVIDVNIVHDPAEAARELKRLHETGRIDLRHTDPLATCGPESSTRLLGKHANV